MPSPSVRILRSAPVLACLAACLAPVAACSDAVSVGDPVFGDADVRILFVGNSLTYTNDLPGMVATIAEVAGHSVSTLAITGGGFALEDHWRYGLADRVRDLRPDFVVMQQGPSSLAESRVHLIAWSDTVARVAREVDATAALLMVWPEEARFQAFSAVRESYRQAAEHVGGLFVPAGDAFRALYLQHPDLDPYGPDQFHPSPLGTIVSALVVVRTLWGQPVTGLPATMTPSREGLPTIRLSESEADILQALADSVVAAGTP